MVIFRIQSALRSLHQLPMKHISRSYETLVSHYTPQMPSQRLRLCRNANLEVSNLCSFKCLSFPAIWTVFHWLSSYFYLIIKGGPNDPVVTGKQCLLFFHSVRTFVMFMACISQGTCVEFLSDPRYLSRADIETAIFHTCL